MSAIFGVVHWDGRAVSGEDLARMDTALAEYGQDDSGTWCEASAGLGHRLSSFTPEDRFERQPVMCGGDQGVVVADARIDNRDELARRWSLRHEDARTWPDSAFVARALESWHDDGPAQLRGAFAIAHWDRRLRRLLLARSPFSERPLFYYSSGRTFTFASMPKALFGLGVTRRALDEESLADFLSMERPDPGRSFFRDVRRVPGGHVLVVTDRGAEARRFWRPDLIRELRLPTDAAYVEAFLDVYARAVRDVLRSAHPVGVMVSGGLDSSSIVGMAAPMLAARGQRLAGFTEVPPTNFTGPVLTGCYADETPFVEKLAERHANFDLSLIRPGPDFHLEQADERYRAAEAPVTVTLNMPWWDALMATAQRQGAKVLLRGLFGNFTVSYGGGGLLPRLVAGFRWRAMFREAHAIARANGRGSALRIVAASGVRPLLPTWLNLGLERLRTPWARCAHPLRRYAAVHPGFARSQRVRQRARAMGHDTRLSPERDTRTYRSLLLPRLGSLLDGQSAGYLARFGVDLRDPTADTRVAEFCLSLPERLFLQDGRPRWLIRQAMLHRVPTAILENPRRGLQAADWFTRLQRHRGRLLEEIDRIDRSDLARRAIDVRRLRQLVDGMPPVNPGDAATFGDYRGVLDLGLEVGRFILWAEGDHVAGRRA